MEKERLSILDKFPHEQKGPVHQTVSGGEREYKRHGVSELYTEIESWKVEEERGKARSERS